MLFDSLDNTPWVYPFRDNKGTPNTSEKRYTIAHEIGHALGLDHVGLLLKTPFCAVAAANNLGGNFEGGTNSPYCYGWGQPHHVGANVMGYGSSPGSTLPHA
jgi:hypothetical protein